MNLDFMFPYKKYTLRTKYSIEECIQILNKLDARFTNNDFFVYEGVGRLGKVPAITEIVGSVLEINGVSCIKIKFNIGGFGKLFILFGFLFGIASIIFTFIKSIESLKFVTTELIGLIPFFTFYILAYLFLCEDAEEKLKPFKKVFKAEIV